MHISIHALLAESDDVYKEANFPGFAFLSTLSLRRATLTGLLTRSMTLFLSTLSLRRATSLEIITFRYYHNFYPRSPCGERRLFPAPRPTSINNFYPRSPCGERRRPAGQVHGQGYFYPRSPCGERPYIHLVVDGSIDISIHALLAESDIPATTRTASPCTFLSTLSLRRATDDILAGVNELLISIHALLAESDGKSNKLAGQKLVFLSTLSLRRATQGKNNGHDTALFLSTLSLRRATMILQP